MQLKGTAVSQGYAVGEAFLYRPYTPELEESYIKESETESAIAAYRNARLAARAELEAIIYRLEQRKDSKSKIFSAHIGILFDPAIEEDVEELICEELYSPQWAVKKTYDKYIRIIKKGRDKTIGERADDLKDVSTRLLRCMSGVAEANLSVFEKPIILVAHDLMPSDTAGLDRNSVLAILTEVGGPTSHSAIIAKSYGIPAVLAVPELTGLVTNGDLLAVDACKGTVELSPDRECVEEHSILAEAFALQKEKSDKYRAIECRTADGIHIDINLNIAGGTPEELEAASYLDGIGLFRTEFLFMGRDRLPDEEEQYEAYKNILSAFGGKPVTLRTLDIGGDKQTACIAQPREDNPFLGRRALRLCFDMPELFKTQIRAALRASVFGKLWLMLPMVGSMEDIYLAKKYIREAEEELTAQGIPYDHEYKLGIMVEIPSIALMADLAAQEVDFASIGSNDLCQYTLAVDRMSPTVSKYYQPFNPGVIRLIKYTVDLFNMAGKPVCICGEMGGDPAAALLLVGLGMRKLSMSIASVARVKELLSRFSTTQAEQLALQALSQKTASGAEDIIKNAIESMEV